jgi:hypothetical protein
MLNKHSFNGKHSQNHTTITRRATSLDGAHCVVVYRSRSYNSWWRQQNADTQALIKKFVVNGQLEFINGGWCMHDEAVSKSAQNNH